MKKWIVLIISCFMTAAVYAQSTCETRVDAHQKATTNQRVAYCLTPDTVPADVTYSELVYSEVSTPQMKQTQKQTPRTTTKPGRFDPEKVTVARTYVATTQFPQVEGEETTYTVAVDATQTSSNTPVANAQENSVTVSTDTTPHGALVPVERFMSDEVVASASAPAQIFTESQAGLTARQAKPKRYLKLVVKPEPAPAPAVEEAQTPAQKEPTAATTNLEGNAATINAPGNATGTTQSDLPETIVDDLYTEIPATNGPAPATESVPAPTAAN